MTDTSSTSLTLLERLRSAFGSIFLYTLIRDAHRSRMHALRVLCIGAVSALILLVFLQYYRFPSYYGNPWAMVGREMFGIFAVVQIAVALIFAPILTGGAISSERSGGTLETLLSTPITPTQLVLAKCFTRMLELVITLFGILPIAVVLMWFGGIDWTTVLLVEALVLLSVLLGGAVGTFFSSISRTGWGGLVGASLFLPVFWVISLFVLVLDHGSTAGWLAAAMTPIGPAVETTMRIGRYPPYATIGCFIWNGLLALGFLLASVRAMEARAMIEGPGLIRRVFIAIRSRLRPVARPWQGGTGSSVRGNPVLWRELHRRWIGGWWTWAVLLCTAIAALGLLCELCYSSKNLNRGEFQTPLLLFLYASMVVTAVVFSGIAFSPEKESATLDLVLMTDLTPGQVLWGKFAGVARLVAVPLILLVLDLLLVFWLPYARMRYALVDPGDYWSFRPCLVLCLPVLQALFFVLAGLWFSLRFQRTAAALGGSAAFAFACNVGGILVVLFVSALGVGYSGGGLPTAIIPMGVYVLAAKGLLWGRTPEIAEGLIVQIFILCSGIVILIPACLARLRRLGGR